MLDFANRPPKKPEDASLSRIGKGLLIETGQARLPFVEFKAYARAMSSEIVEACGPRPDPKLVDSVTRHVIDQTVTLLGDNKNIEFIADDMIESTTEMLAIQGEVAA